MCIATYPNGPCSSRRTLRRSQGKGSLLKPASFRAMHNPLPGSDYAWGWVVGERSWAGGRTLTHNGSNTYWYVAVWIARHGISPSSPRPTRGGPPGEEATDQAASKLIESFAFLTRNKALRHPKAGGGCWLAIQLIRSWICRSPDRSGSMPDRRSRGWIGRLGRPENEPNRNRKTADRAEGSRC